MANDKEHERDYLGRTPYYQSYSVVFNSEALGLEVQKMHDIPVVRRLVNQNARFAGAAEKGGVSIGSLLVGGTIAHDPLSMFLHALHAITTGTYFNGPVL